MTPSNDYYIVNISHSHREARYVSFWRPECKGYAYPLSWAGKYGEAEVRADLGYYNSGENIAVPCEVVDALTCAPRPGDIDGDAGPVVLSTEEHWKVLTAHAIAKPKYKLRPFFFGSRHRTLTSKPRSPRKAVS
jgi:hypothetical protein